MKERGTNSLRIDRDVLLALDRALELEWLETDGRGGYAASSVHLCNRRRQHGLLVAPFEGTVKRHVFLSRLEEHVHTGEAGAERAHPLSMARYAGSYAPLGHAHAESFELVPYPRWTYRLDELEIERELLVVRGSPTVLVRWRAGACGPHTELDVEPVLAFRDADALHLENLAFDTRITALDDASFAVRPYSSLPRLTLGLAGLDARTERSSAWLREVEYEVDQARGYDGREALFSPAQLRAPLRPGAWLTFFATLDEAPEDPAELFEREAGRRRAELAAAGEGRAARFTLGADDFLYRTPVHATRAGAPDKRERTGVIAGFPWFVEWGRDTCIALPGLLLARGRVEDCGEVLEDLAGFLHNGLLPNIFGLDREDSHYGSVDASLWFSRAVLLYDRAGGDRERLHGPLLAALVHIAERYIEGTRLGVQSDADGLLRAGSPELNATWMDARTAAGPVTPRHGFAVELNALWHQLLAYLRELHERTGDRARARAWRSLEELSGRSFLERFWIEDQGLLADLWRDGAPHLEVRPNMVIAAALEHSPLSEAQRAAVVTRSERELLTPRGLRTLSPADPDYQGTFAGGPEERDRAYHQGTVWPWLFGFHVEASLRAFPGDAERRERLARQVDEIVSQCGEAGLAHVSEVFDGDPPHRPGGTFAQAWNTAELLRSRALLAKADA